MPKEYRTIHLSISLNFSPHSPLFYTPSGCLWHFFKNAMEQLILSSEWNSGLIHCDQMIVFCEKKQ